MPHADLPGGLRLHYVEEGTGEPVLLVHGGMGSHREWALQVPALASRYRVVRVDVRGHGASTPFGAPGNPWSALSIETFTDDLLAFFDVHLAGERVHLVGASMGSLLAQRVAVEAPHRVRSLVAATSPPLASEALRQFLRKGRAQPPPERIASEYAEAHGEPYWRELRERLLGYLAEMPEEVYPQALLRTYKGPAWVVEAGDDAAYSPVGTAFWYAWLPQARLDRTTGGHWFYRDGGEGTAWFNENLLKFLEGAHA